MWSVPTHVVVETLDEGIVVFDKSTETVLCLTGPATDVMSAAHDATLAEIADACGLTSAQAAAYLGELADRGLVVTSDGTDELARRSLMRAAGGAVVALGVWSMAAPNAAATHSGHYE